MKRLAMILAAAALFITAAHGQQKRWAVVNLSGIYMRIAPDYESALETQELMGTVVEIVGEKGYWREIVSPQPYQAWCTEKGIVEMSEQEIKEYLKENEYCNAYLLTVDKPKHSQTNLPYRTFKVELTDLENGDRGEGLYYMDLENYAE